MSMTNEVMRSSALSAAKMNDQEAFTFYRDGMVKNSVSKAVKIVHHFPESLDPGSTVLDIGTCSGALVRDMRTLRPELRYVGVDLSHRMLVDAVHRTPQVGFVEADALHLPIPPQSVSVITMSSILHEIYSYAGKKFTYEAVMHCLKDAKRLLKLNGRIIIKDPAKPENPDELLIFSLSSTDGHDHDDADLLSAHPGELSTHARYRRFLHEFHPLKDKVGYDFHRPINRDQRLYRAPAWLLSEFLRHRNLAESPQIWSSEMQERYGVFTKNEAREALSEAGFTNVMVKTSFNPGNHSAIKQGEVQIWSLQGDVVDQASRLPTGMLIIGDNPLIQ